MAGSAHSAAWAGWWKGAVARRTALEFRPAVDRNACTGDPPCGVGCDKGDDVGHVLGLADSLQRLDAEGILLARFGLREARHVSVDDSRRDGVNTDAARP